MILTEAEQFKEMPIIIHSGRWQARNHSSALEGYLFKLESVCMCVCAFMYMCLCARMHTYVCSHVCALLCACVCVCLCLSFMHVHRSISSECTCVRVHVRRCTHMCRRKLTGSHAIPWVQSTDLLSWNLSNRLAGQRALAVCLSVCPPLPPQH